MCIEATNVRHGCPRNTCVVQQISDATQCINTRHASRLDPQADFVHRYGMACYNLRLFSAKPENSCWQINFGPENYSGFQMYCYNNLLSPAEVALLVMQRTTVVFMKATVTETITIITCQKKDLIMYKLWQPK